MRSLLALLAIALFSLCAIACGRAGTDTGSTSPVSSNAAATGATATTASNTSTQNYTKADSDKDNDIGTPHDAMDNSRILDFANPASASDQHAITSLVKRYYAVAAAEDGNRACSLLYSTLSEAVPEDYGLSPPGPPYMKGTTCPAVMTLFFKHFHDQITVELPKLKVSRVRLMEHHGLAVLNFGTMPERQILVAREGHVWKIEALLDSELP